VQLHPDDGVQLHPDDGVQLHPDDGVHTKKGVGLCWFCDRNNRAKAMGCTVWAS
jgi:hypothetical protein